VAGDALRLARVRRWGVRAALYLVAGAVVAWGVAGGCAMWAERTDNRSHPGTAWPVEVPPHWPPPGVEMSARGRGVWFYLWEYSGNIIRLGPDGSREQITRPSEQRSFLIYRMEAGWPARAFGFEFRGESGGAKERRGILPVPAFLGADANCAGLPMLILPWGFALCTLFYGAALLGVVEGAAYARRRLRGKGLCATCGYDRAGLAEGAACPECGGGGGGGGGGGL
jgi:hypothetical protein